MGEKLRILYINVDGTAESINKPVPIVGIKAYKLGKGVEASKATIE